MMPNGMSSSKITSAHLAKLAYVYVRQSSLGQVLRNNESTDMQYRLLDRAVGFGWPTERVVVVDEDLGKSGASADERLGFQAMIAEIGLGHVGLVLSLDASRLARNNGDWYRLLELCSMFGTLLADSEQLYDPRAYHDRLLLGLSGMMSEAELHHLRMRLQAGGWHKAERGELRVPLPVGLLRVRDGAVILNPDEEVRARIHLVFEKFCELGSARAVTIFLAREGFLLPSRPPIGPAPHDTFWNQATHSAVMRILRTPAYAGAYVYGRRRTDPTRRTVGSPKSGLVELPIEQWPICLHDAYPAYISWETYLANQARLRANANRYARGGIGVPRQGSALLQGITICGRCGRHMLVGYSGHEGEYPYYSCSQDQQQYRAPLCQQVRAIGLDSHVEQLVLEALEPERIVLALNALEQIELEMTTLERQWQLKLERARYEATRAQRQFNSVEPEDRLVARSLEREWEQRLRAVEQAEREYEAWKRENREQISGTDRTEILALGQNLPKVWHADTTTHEDRKYLLRLLVTEVLVDQKRERGKVWFQINWQTGARTDHSFTRTCISYRDHGDIEQIERQVRELNAQGVSDRRVADALNAEGYRTTYGQPFNFVTVCDLRKQWDIPNVKERGLRPGRLRWEDGAYTIRGVVEAVGVTASTVRRWLEIGRIHGTQLGRYMLWRITLTKGEIRLLREQARRVRVSRGQEPSRSGR